MHLTFNSFLKQNKNATKEQQNGRTDTMKLWITLKCHHNLPLFVSPGSEENLHEIEQKFPQYTFNSYSITKQLSSTLKLLLYYKLRGINTIFFPNIRLYPHTALFRLYLMTASLSLYKLRFISSMKLRPKIEQHSNNTFHAVTVKKFC